MFKKYPLKKHYKKCKYEYSSLTSMQKIILDGLTFHENQSITIDLLVSS